MPRTAPNSRLAQAVVPVLAGLAFLVVLGLLTWGVALFASHNSGEGGVKVNLGADTFNAGLAKSRAQEIESQGPLLFPGLINGAERRAIGLYHLGTAELRGWVAYSLVPPGAPSTCVLTLDRAARQLVSPCDGRRFPATGEGLDMFKVSITPDKELAIDLGRGGNASTATSAPSAATSAIPTISGG